MGFVAPVRGDFVFARISAHARVEVRGKDVPVLNRPEFHWLRGRPGVAIIDYRHDGPDYGQVVSVLPVEQITSRARVTALLDLPKGSITQRTLIWALRVHPAHPESTEGSQRGDLMLHAKKHAHEQARLNYQHHNMPYFATSEIVAESWPWNKCIVAAALDMVDAWSQSPGHWEQASREHRYYGYDMWANREKWFATGVFVD